MTILRPLLTAWLCLVVAVIALFALPLALARRVVTPMWARR